MPALNPFCGPGLSIVRLVVGTLLAMVLHGCSTTKQVPPNQIFGLPDTSASREGGTWVRGYISPGGRRADLDGHARTAGKDSVEFIIRKPASPAEWDKSWSAAPSARLMVPRDSVRALLVRKKEPVTTVLFAAAIAGLAVWVGGTAGGLP